MAAIPINFTVYKGADFEITLNIRNITIPSLILVGILLKHIWREITLPVLKLI